MGSNGKSRKIGSYMSSKQLAHSVRNGRLVAFHFPHALEQIVGYLCGMDDYHWMVVTPEGSKHLIHKGSVSCIDLRSESTFEDEELRDELEQVVGPFRAFVEEEYFSSRLPIREKEVVG